MTPGESGYALGRELAHVLLSEEIDLDALAAEHYSVAQAAGKITLLESDHRLLDPEMTFTFAFIRGFQEESA